MAEESFLLLSLKEEKSKKLAQVISNATSRKILDYMGSRGNQTITETEIAKALSLPISTVHYNMNHLVKASLVKTDEFHYSEKGKEVNHYSLSNKMIIIAPSNSEKFMEKLKKIIPVAIVALVAAGFIQLFSKFFSGSAGTFAAKSADAAQPMLKATATAAAPAAQAVGESAQELGLSYATDPVVQPCIQSCSSYPFALWFLFGAAFTLVLYFIWDWFRDRKK